MPARSLRLSRRQREILLLCAGDKREKEIGEMLHISTNTVHNHLSQARIKLGVGSTAAAVALVLNGQA